MNHTQIIRRARDGFSTGIRRLSRDEGEGDVGAEECLKVVKTMLAALPEDEESKLREMLADMLIGEAEPEAAEPEAQDRRRRRMGHDAALPRGVLPIEARYPFMARIRTLSSY